MHINNHFYLNIHFFLQFEFFFYYDSTVLFSFFLTIKKNYICNTSKFNLSWYFNFVYLNYTSIITWFQYLFKMVKNFDLIICIIHVLYIVLSSLKIELISLVFDQTVQYSGNWYKGLITIVGFSDKLHSTWLGVDKIKCSSQPILT